MTEPSDIRQALDSILHEFLFFQRASLSGHKGEAFRIGSQIVPESVEQILALIESEKKKAVEEFIERYDASPRIDFESMIRPGEAAEEIITAMFPQNQ